MLFFFFFLSPLFVQGDDLGFACGGSTETCALGLDTLHHLECRETGKEVVPIPGTRAPSKGQRMPLGNENNL